MTKERKILFTILAVGAIAFLIDRSTGGAKSLTAPEAAEAADSIARAPLADSIAPVNAQPQQHLSARISNLAQADLADSAALASTRDPFRISPGWIALKPDNQAAAQSPSDRFEKNHKLTAIIVSGKRSSAVVDGSLLKVGQSVDGFTLIAVTQDMAILDSNGARVVLKLTAAIPAASGVQ
jgi:hypothetical protein